MTQSKFQFSLRGALFAPLDEGHWILPPPHAPEIAEAICCFPCFEIKSTQEDEHVPASNSDWVFNPSYLSDTSLEE